MLKLIEPTMEYDREIQDYKREFLEADNSMDGCGSLRRFENTADWLACLEACKHRRIWSRPRCTFASGRRTDGSWECSRFATA